MLLTDYGLMQKEFWIFMKEQAGGKLSTELYKKFAEYALEQGKLFVVMYGQRQR